MMSDKHEFLKKVEERLQDMQASINILKLKLSNAPAEEKPDLAKKLEKTEIRYLEGVKRLEDLNEVSDLIWDGLQDELEIFWEQLSKE